MKLYTSFLSNFTSTMLTKGGGAPLRRGHNYPPLSASWRCKLEEEEEEEATVELEERLTVAKEPHRWHDSSPLSRRRS